MQGATLQSAHVDEAPLCHVEFLPFLWTRFSTDPARLIMTLNPEGPAHHFRHAVVDRLDEWDAELMEFAFDDNPVLSERAKERIKAGLTGHFYKRLVLGQWAGATGLIFPTVRHSDAEPVAPVWHCGLDWGAASTTAAVLLASERSGGRFPWRSVVVAEWYHDARVERTLTDAEVAEKVDRWLQSETNGAAPGSVRVYVDPATHAAFKVLLKRRGYAVRNAKNDVLPGIAATDARLSAGSVALKPGAAPNLEAEIASYSWCERASDRGEDRPAATPDHAVDALRYAVFSTSKLTAVEQWRAKRAVEAA